MDSGGILGILVNSDRHFDYILKLTEAATAKGRQVQIHVLDRGAGLLCSDALGPLSRMARISACSVGSGARADGVMGSPPAPVEIIAPDRLPDLLQRFDRMVVF